MLTAVQGRGRGVRRRRGTDWGRNSSAWRQRLPRRTRRSSFAVTRAGSPPSALLVFVTAVPISNFVRAARLVGLEVLAELDLDDDYALDEALLAPHREMVSPTLYATMPTRESFERLLGLWRAYQRGERSEKGHAPWTRLFEMLDDLRVWGPEDRLSAEARVALEERLAEDEAAEHRLELEVWPTRSQERRERWRGDAERRVAALGGRVLSRSSIEEEGFIHEALLVALSAGSVRELIAHPEAVEGLATLDGLQFVLPQVVAQSLPNQSEPLDAPGLDGAAAFDSETPRRAVRLDGTPVAGHRSLDGGVVIEDVHDLVGRSVVAQRRHATSMASLILRGDLTADGAPMPDSRLLSIPVLVDAEGGASSPEDRLFVDVVHVALTRALAGAEPLAPEAFVVNFSVGIRRSSFSGRISSLARLLDWWAHSEGVLFVVSSGNVLEDLGIPGMTSVAFEEATLQERRELVAAARRAGRHERTLLAPSEALNALTVGAASVDLAPAGWAPRPGEVAIQDDGEPSPAISTAHGPRPFGAIKPDLLAYGGRHDVRTIAAGDNLRLRVMRETGRSGVFVAAARAGPGDLERARNELRSGVDHARGVECGGRVDWGGWPVCGSGVVAPGPRVADEGPGGQRVTLAGGGACALPGGTPQNWKGPALSGEGGSGAAIRSWGSGRGPDARGAWIRRDPGWCGNREEGYGAGVRCSVASVDVGRFRASRDGCDARVVFADGGEPGPVSACGTGSRSRRWR